MKPMREKIQTKLNSMASILMDDIIIPDKKEQEGAETISASFYDKNENKFSFTLSLTVTPKEKEEDETTTPINTTDAILSILEKITALEQDIAELKGYHNEPVTDPDNNTPETPETTENGE